MENVTATMATLDWVIVCVYMLGIIALGLYASRGQDRLLKMCRHH